MHRITDKVMIYLGCSLLYIYNMGISTETTVVLLCAILAACCNAIIDYVSILFHKTDYRQIETVYYQTVYILLTLLTFARPVLILFLPLLFYDSYRYRHKLAPIIISLSLICHIQTFPLSFFIILLLLCIISIMLSHYGNQKEQLTKELILLRDTSKEHAKLIEANNKILQQQQDGAIYTATLKERNRIAREIHDNVGHLLTRSILQTGAIKTINQADNLKEPINMLNDTLNTAMTNIRQSVHDLHDESVDLKAAIDDILAPIDSFQVTFHYDITNHVRRDIKYAIIAITKEAVNNCLKYSNGDKIHVLLREHPGFYQLLIEDNGTDIHLSDNSGMGLKNIQERANAIYGNAKILTDNGFRILVTVKKEEPF